MNKFGFSNAMTLVFYPPYSSFRKNNTFQNWDQTLFPLTAKKIKSKIMIIRCMVPEIRCATEERTDGETNGQKK